MIYATSSKVALALVVFAAIMLVASHTAHPFEGVLGWLTAALGRLA